MKRSRRERKPARCNCFHCWGVRGAHEPAVSAVPTNSAVPYRASHQVGGRPQSCSLYAGDICLDEIEDYILVIVLFNNICWSICSKTIDMFWQFIGSTLSRTLQSRTSHMGGCESLFEIILSNCLDNVFVYDFINVVSLFVSLSFPDIEHSILASFVSKGEAGGRSSGRNNARHV